MEILKEEYLKEEFRDNILELFEQADKLFIKLEYEEKSNSKFYRRYELISDDYSFKSVIELNLMQTSNNWPYVQLIQTESELDRDEIKVSDSYGWDEFSNKSQSQIDKKVAQIDKRAEKEINKFQNKPRVHIRKGFYPKDEDCINSKYIDTDIIYTDKYSDGGFRYDQPSKAYRITSNLPSNTTLHVIHEELNTADIISLYKQMIKED